LSDRHGQEKKVIGKIGEYTNTRDILAARYLQSAPKLFIFGVLLALIECRT